MYVVYGYVYKQQKDCCTPVYSFKTYSVDTMYNRYKATYLCISTHFVIRILLALLHRILHPLQ
jgi:hypothetical protein